MEIIDIKGPHLPDSIANAKLESWKFAPNEFVEAGQVIAICETDKISMEVTAVTDGVISEIVVPAGETILSEALIGKFQPQVKTKDSTKNNVSIDMKETSEKLVKTVELEKSEIQIDTKSTATIKEVKAETNLHSPKVQPIPQVKPVNSLNKENDFSLAAEQINLGPRVRRLINEYGVTSDEVESYLRNKLPPRVIANEIKMRKINEAVNPFKTRVPMTTIRKHIAQRLLESKNNTAMLTTFNEVDLEAIINIRKKYGEFFLKKHNIRLGFMSFFVKAVSEAMKEFPIISACIEGDDIVYSNTTDISIAVSTERGLVTPVLRSCENKTLAQIEKEISDLATKGNNNKLTIEDMTGGNFTITNGGVFGSLFSTPIINPPQSAILGMHGIKKRPVVVDNEIVIRPMMYIALSYDHRLIDGKDSVRFLYKVKELLEDPTQILLDL